MRLIAIFILCFGSMLSAFSEDNALLDDLVSRGLNNNPKLHASYQLWQAQREKIPQASSLPDPIASYTYFGENVETRVGPQEEKYGFAQTTPFPGKLFQKGQIAKRQAEISKEQYEAEKHLLIERIKSTYYDIFWVDKATEIIEQEKSTVANLEKVTQKKYEINLAPQQDVVKAQVELSLLIDKLITLSKQRRILVSKLKSLLNASGILNFDKILFLKRSDFDYSLEELNSLAKDYRQDLKIAGLEFKQSEHELALAKLDFLPDFTWGVDYIKIGSDTTSHYNDGQDAWMATVKVTLPFWMGKQIAQLKEKNAEKLASQENLNETENKVQFEVDETYYIIKNNMEIISLYETALLPQTKQAFESARTGYESGEVDFLDWLEAERVMLNTRLAYYRAICDYEKSIARLERIIGKDL